jgi:2-methylcitrate dehydratase
VQALLHQVTVRADEAFSRRFPAEMPCRVRVTRRDGSVLTAERSDYPGFITGGRTWEAARAKLEALAGPCTPATLRDQLATTISRLEEVPVAELTGLLATAVPMGIPMARNGVNR